MPSLAARRGPPNRCLRQEDMDLARSIQEVTEEVMVRLARTLHRETGVDHLCLAGGVALNCVGNGRILREGPFQRPLDSARRGRCRRRRRRGARGLAPTRCAATPLPARTVVDGMQGAFLGPAFSNAED